MFFSIKFIGKGANARSESLSAAQKFLLFYFQDGLSDRIKRVLNDCWDKRDAHGGIADPKGLTGQAIWGRF
jgi:hypothetical protein